MARPAADRYRRHGRELRPRPDACVARLRQGDRLGRRRQRPHSVGKPEYCTTPAPTRAVEVLLARAVRGGRRGIRREPRRHRAARGRRSGARMAPASTAASGAVAAATPHAGRGVAGVRDVVAGEFQCAAIDRRGQPVHVGPQPRRRARSPGRAVRSARRRAWPDLPATRELAVGKGYMLALTQDQRGLRVGRQRGRAARARTPQAPSTRRRA